MDMLSIRLRYLMKSCPNRVQVQNRVFIRFRSLQDREYIPKDFGYLAEGGAVGGGCSGLG